MEVFVDLEPYLRDWFLYFCGTDREPVELPRGSIEGKILRVFLRAPRADEKVTFIKPHGWTAIRVPVFRGHNPDSENYLSDKARIALKTAIRDRFDIDLWQSMGDWQLRGEMRNVAIEAWMEARGIEDTPTNTEAVTRRLTRLITRAQTRGRQKKFREKKN